jgi:hypothetical protein
LIPANRRSYPFAVIGCVRFSSCDRAKLILDITAAVVASVLRRRAAT